jgi:hypothetical protein
MAQFGRPSTDTTRDNWVEDDGTTTDIFDQIDESIADDADYIKTQLTPTSDVYVTKLTTLEDPISSSNHVVRFRYRKDAAGGDAIDLITQLRQGYVNEGAQGTLIAAQTNNDISGSGWVDGTFTLSGAEADAITDYTDLYLRFVGNKP